MLNYNHALETINHVLKDEGYRVERRVDGFGEPMFILQEKTEDGYQDCGTYYKKKWLMEDVNQILIDDKIEKAIAQQKLKELGVE